MLRIWGRITSINVRKAVWTAQELGLPFERIDAGMQFGIVQTPEFMRMNPNARVPVIDDEGFILWESNVVVRYLCARHSPGKLYPEKLEARFDAERWMDWQQTTANPASRDVFIQMIRTPEAQRDASLIAKSSAATEAVMVILDAQLANRPFITGDQFSMADLALGGEADRWYGLPLQRKPRPNVERWFKTLCQRPGARGVLGLPPA